VGHRSLRIGLWHRLHYTRGGLVVNSVFYGDVNHGIQLKGSGWGVPRKAWQNTALANGKAGSSRRALRPTCGTTSRTGSPGRRPRWNAPGRCCPAT
jgi:hypothetical protein